MVTETDTTGRDSRANLAGSLWMIGAMALFSVEDVLIKIATTRLPLSVVLIVFGLGGAVLFALVAWSRREPLLQAGIVSTVMAVRFALEVTGRLFYTLALAFTPLSTTTAILQATPIVVVFGAMALFREKVGVGRWVAILVGLAGVLIILRPAPGTFSPLSILALVGMIGFAGRDLASRAAARSIPTSVLGVYGFLAVVVAGALYAPFEAEADRLALDGPAALALVGAIVCGASAYSALMKAMRTGAVSAVTPFRYTRLPFGIALGMLAFDERIDLATIVGSCVIVVAGVAILKRR